MGRLGLPRVIGEILGGLALGSTFLGHLYPDLFRALYFSFPEQPKIVSVLYWQGLLLLMFVSGFGIDSSFSRTERRTVTLLVIGATVLPFAFAFAFTSFFDLSRFLGPRNNLLSLRVIIAISFAVTSIPVISRIFLDLGIIRSRLAKLVLATATVEDLLLLVLLSFALSVGAAGSASPQPADLHHAALVILASVTLFAAVPGITRLVRAVSHYLQPAPSKVAFTLCAVLIAFAALFHINVIFGAFVAGVVVSLLPEEEYDAVKRHVLEVSTAFFIPIYFAIVGLRLNLWRDFDVPFTVAFIGASLLAKSLGVYLALRMMKVDSLSIANVAIALNARGGPGIVIATVAYDAGIIDARLFTTFVITALVTSAFAEIWLRAVIRRGLPLFGSFDVATVGFSEEEEELLDDTVPAYPRAQSNPPAILDDRVPR